MCQIKFDYICLPWANGGPSSLLLLCMITSSFCRVPSRIGIILCLGNSNSGISLIFKCLFLWNIFLIWENAKQGPSSNCMVLWPNAPIVWESLLHNRWHFCVSFHELFLQVSSWVDYRIKAENGAVYPRNTQTHAFISCVFPCLFSFLLYFYSVLTSLLHFLSAFLSFSSMRVWLFWINVIIVAEFSLYTFLGAWRPII